MSIVDNKTLDPNLVVGVNEDPQPTKNRIMGSLSYTASFLGGCVSNRYIFDGISAHRHTYNRSGYSSYDDRMPCNCNCVSSYR